MQTTAYMTLSSSNRTQRGGSTLLTIFVLVLLAALVGGSVYLWNTLATTTTGMTKNTDAPRTGIGMSTPERAEEILESARAHLREDHPEKARVLLDLATREYPADQDLRVAYAEALLGVVQNERAYEQYVEALRIGPRKAWIEAAAGTLASKLGNQDVAMSHYKAAQQMEPTEVRHPLYLGQLQRTAGMRTEAQASMLMVLRIEPEHAMAAGTLADMLLEDNAVEQSLRQVSIARTVEPENEVWKLVEARGLSRVGKPEQAMLLLQTMNQDFLLKEHVRSLYGQVCGMLHRPTDAANLYARAVEYDPKNTGLVMETAAWFERAKNYPRALDFARTAEQLGGQNAEKMVDRLNQQLAEASAGGG